MSCRYPHYATPYLPDGDIFCTGDGRRGRRGLCRFSAQGRSARIISQTQPLSTNTTLTVTTANLAGIKEFAPADLYVTVGRAHQWRNWRLICGIRNCNACFHGRRRQWAI
ncbi:MAG: hypothetical protein R2867_43555 [Caldilineaceae bacterium]